MMKLLFGVIAPIGAAMMDGVYLRFNPVILIFVILGFGIYMVGRIRGPLLPDDAPVVWGSGHGVYLHSRDYAAADTSCGGDDPKEGDGFR